MNNLIIEEHYGITYTISLDAGGRIVSITDRKGRERLKTNELVLNKEYDIPKPTPFTDFEQYFGIETWIGPQSHWWEDQTANKERLESPIKWPPDPYVTYGRFKITKKDSESIELEGETSPLTGIKMCKRYDFSVDGVTLNVKITNNRSYTRDVDIWNIVRVPGHPIVKTWTTNKDHVRYDTPTHNYERPVYGKITKNGDIFVFEFDNDKMLSDKSLPESGSWGGDGNIHAGKALIYPCSESEICAEYSEMGLKVMSQTKSIGKYHPDVTPVEIYCYLSPDKEKSMFELETHSELLHLESGASAEFATAIKLL